MVESYTCPWVNAWVWEHPGWVNSAHTAAMNHIQMLTQSVDTVQQYIDGIVQLQSETLAEVEWLRKDAAVKQEHCQARPSPSALQNSLCMSSI